MQIINSGLRSNILASNPQTDGYIVTETFVLNFYFTDGSVKVKKHNDKKQILST